MDIIIKQPISQPIKVEKGVKPPEKRVHYSVLPFHEMEVGDSFFVERGRFRTKYFFDVRAFIYQKAKQYRMETGAEDKFITSVEREKNGVRCWRIE